MTQLSRDVAALERAQADGQLAGRDLEVIARQVSRAEEKVLKLTKANPLSQHQDRIPQARAA